MSFNAECARCAAPFEKYRPTSRYCSQKCRQRAATAAHRQRQPAAVRAQWRAYFYTERGTITALLGNAKSRAAKAGLPFALSRDWLQAKLAAGVCELSGLALEHKPRSDGDGSRAHPFAPSLDRIIPALGYVEHNVRLTCFAVNQARSDYGDAVLRQIARALVASEGAQCLKELTSVTMTPLARFQSTYRSRRSEALDEPPGPNRARLEGRAEAAKDALDWMLGRPAEEQQEQGTAA